MSRTLSGPARRRPGVIGGTPTFDSAGISMGGGKVIYGSTITQLIDFLIAASVVYFGIVVPMKTLAARRRNGVEGDTPAPSDETVLLAEIRDLLRAQQR
jgi:large conductance mechanosensitive channel